MKKNKLKKKKKKNTLLIIQTITTVVVGIATIWSFINSKQIQDKLTHLEKLKLMPEIRVKMTVDSVNNCDDEKEKMLLFTINNSGYKVKKVISADVTAFLSLNTQINKIDTTLFIPLNSNTCFQNFNTGDGILYTLKKKTIFDEFDNLESKIETICRTIKGKNYYRYMSNIELSYFLKIYYKNFIGEYKKEFYSIKMYANGITKISPEEASFYTNTMSEGTPNSITSINPSRIAELSLFDIPNNYDNFWVSSYN